MLDAIRELEMVEGFAVEREDFCGYLAVTKTAGLPSFLNRIPESWLEE